MASCQHAIWHQSLKSSHIRSFSRGYSSFRQRSREPYILPRLVIDLDSSDNRYVRREEDGAGTIQDAANYRPKRAQEVKTGRPGPRSEITTPRKGNKTAEHESRNDRDMRRGFWTMRIGRGNNNGLFKASTTSPLDILTWALNGDEAGAETVPEQEPNIHFSDTTMDVSTSINTTGVGLRDKSIWTRIGRTFVPLARLHREISSLCSTAKGCKFLLEKESLVVMALQFYNTRRPYGTKAGSARAVKSRILRLLNNIHINMKSKGLEIGPALCNAGLYYSSVTDTSESLAMYLQIMVANGYELTEYTPWALNQVLRKVRPMDLSQAATNRLTDHTVLSLVTGTEPDGPICPLEQRNPSFASLLRQNQPEDLATRLYKIYLVTLGKIGAGKHLMQEYQTAQNSQVSHVPRSLRGDENSVRRAHLFAVAFILARDVENAAAILKNGLVPGENRGEENTVRPIISSLYRSHKIEIAANFDSQLRSFVSNDWESALDLIQKLIDYDALLTAEGEVSGRRVVMWAENEDGTGQAVVKPTAVEQEVEAEGGMSEFDISLWDLTLDSASQAVIERNEAGHAYKEDAYGMP